MNLEHYRGLLLDKERELEAELAPDDSVAQEENGEEVQDEMDRVVQSEAKDGIMNRHSQNLLLLRSVRDALRRIDAGTYGRCLECGRPISEKRLEAIPWAEYDLQHQEEHDRQTGQPAKEPTL